MDRVKKLIHCRDAFALGITGRGVGVAVLDTGIFLHRDMENRVTAFADMVGHRRAPYRRERGCIGGKISGNGSGLQPDRIKGS